MKADEYETGSTRFPATMEKSRLKSLKAMHIHSQKLGDLDLWDGTNERDLIREEIELSEQISNFFCKSDLVKSKGITKKRAFKAVNVNKTFLAIFPTFFYSYIIIQTSCT